MNWNSRILPLQYLFIFGLIFIFFSNPVFSQNENKPNILIIFTDDQGYHDVSYYGTQDLNTPNIDALRADGMRFDYFYTNSPVCAPTRASLMTGRYPDRVGVPGLIRFKPEDNWGFLDPSAVLLPAKLKDAGYHTAHIGKWNLGLTSPNLPNQKGFDLFHGWLEDMMEDYVDKRRNGFNYMRLNEQEIDPAGHATDLFSQWAVDYIESREDEEDPFFLYLAYNAPHFPVQPPKEYLDRVKARDPNLPDRRANLIALIEHMDDGIGQVIKTLKETGQYENTLIIFTSDNGGHLPDMANNGDLRDGKQSMYEGGLRVPMVAVWPGKIKAGSTSSQINTTMDVYPTLVELTGLDQRDDMDGRSFMNTLLGNESPESRELYFVRREGGIRYGGKAYHALRLGDWKLLQNSPYQPLELYNLKDDPREQHDLAKEQPEKVQELNRLLMKHIQAGGQVPWQRSKEK
ncbi:sulfatase family protein [Algoriphagus zhangzhouensis]|uniref:Arylsulfatase A n=1 Tax=Algoriphagus zhangzhouensis TaxID=1073327 RepID=A0A1M7Z7S3_9BACT|nr:sulfatase [Algoriphagus zhangzhouensis]TDY49462.1 arylsulfatase A-like enzyme [Algoriphagus zhangzhouensis]SHO60978.1 Arylsulfatase A [Algoriphagus zhangzhouensis]